MKTNESKTDKGKDYEKIVSLKIRKTYFKATKLSEVDRKHTEVKAATYKSILRNRRNTLPGHDEISYQMKKTITIRNNRKTSKNNSNINTARTCTNPVENYNRNNDTKSRNRSQNVKRIQTFIINILPWKTMREHCK